MLGPLKFHIFHTEQTFVTNLRPLMWAEGSTQILAQTFYM